MSTVGGRELKFGGAKMYDRKKFREESVKNRWIATCRREGRKECLTMAIFEPLSLVCHHLKTTSKMPTK
jgi:hypothetical protein